MLSNRLDRAFFRNDVLKVAPELLGKYLVVADGKQTERFVITEAEAYKGEEDLACHASRGKTSRNRIMYADGGHVYVYLIYGMYWMLNFVTGMVDNPQAVLIRGIDGYNGPGKLTRILNIDGSYYGEDLISSNRIWIEKSDIKGEILAGPRIGIEYAGDYWKNKPWRYYLNLQHPD